MRIYGGGRERESSDDRWSFSKCYYHYEAGEIRVAVMADSSAPRGGADAEFVSEFVPFPRASASTQFISRHNRLQVRIEPWHLICISISTTCILTFARTRHPRLDGEGFLVCLNVKRVRRVGAGD